VISAWRSRFAAPEPGRTIGLAWRKTSRRRRDFDALGKAVKTTLLPRDLRLKRRVVDRSAWADSKCGRSTAVRLLLSEGFVRCRRRQARALFKKPGTGIASPSCSSLRLANARTEYPPAPRNINTNMPQGRLRA
jgi:hypothetical protein